MSRNGDAPRKYLLAYQGELVIEDRLGAYHISWRPGSVRSSFTPVISPSACNPAYGSTLESFASSSRTLKRPFVVKTRAAPHE